jgi:hypothetical protein
MAHVIVPQPRGHFLLCLEVRVRCARPSKWTLLIPTEERGGAVTFLQSRLDLLLTDDGAVSPGGRAHVPPQPKPDPPSGQQAHSLRQRALHPLIKFIAFRVFSLAPAECCH